MQQVWAEVYEQLYKKGVKCYLEPDEMAALNNRNESHTSDEPIKDMIDTAYKLVASSCVIMELQKHSNRHLHFSRDDEAN